MFRQCCSLPVQLKRILCFAFVAITVFQGHVRAGDAALGAATCAASYLPSPFPANFWYVKVHKTGGSTVAGMFRAICAHRGIYCIKPAEGATHLDDAQLMRGIVTGKHAGFEHVGVSNHLSYLPKRAQLLSQPLLFTTLREPISHMLSWFNYYGCSKVTKPCEGKSEEELAQMLVAIAEAELQNHQFGYLGGQEGQSPQHLLERYNFVFITNRMPESLVAFMVLYGLGWSDIVQLPAKVQQGTYWGPTELPLAGEQAIAEGRVNITLDQQLFKLAEAKLDEQIEGIVDRCGRAAWERLLVRYDQLQEAVLTQCSEYEAYYQQHGFDSMRVYWGEDNGLAPRCVDAVIQQELLRNGW